MLHQRSAAAALIEQLEHGFSDSEFNLLCLLKKIAYASSSQPIAITAEQAIELLTCDNESIKAIVQELDLKEVAENINEPDQLKHKQQEQVKHHLHPQQRHH